MYKDIFINEKGNAFMAFYDKLHPDLIEKAINENQNILIDALKLILESDTIEKIYKRLNVYL